MDCRRNGIPPLFQIPLAGFLSGVLAVLFVSQVKAFAPMVYSAFGIVASPQAYRLRLSSYQGGSGLYFFDDKVIDRVAFELYPGGRLSCFGLSNRGLAVNPLLFFRLDGSNQNPMLFLKNHRDVHLLDMGVDINQPDENPYLVYWDARGKKQTVFGEFPYIP